jgi:hypothetical protein
MTALRRLAPDVFLEPDRGQTVERSLVLVPQATGTGAAERQSEESDHERRAAWRSLSEQDIC